MVDLGPNSIATLSQSSQYQNEQNSQSNMYSPTTLESERAKSTYPQSRQDTGVNLRTTFGMQQISTPATQVSVRPQMSIRESPQLQMRSTYQPSMTLGAQSIQPVQTLQPTITQAQGSQFFTPLKQETVSSTYSSADSRGPYFQPIVDIRQSEFQKGQQSQVPTRLGESKIATTTQNVGNFLGTGIKNVPSDIYGTVFNPLSVVSPLKKYVPEPKSYEYNAPQSLKSSLLKTTLKVAAENPVKAGAVGYVAPVVGGLYAVSGPIAELASRSRRQIRPTNISDTEELQGRQLVMQYYQEKPVYGVIGAVGKYIKPEMGQGEFKPWTAFAEKIAVGGPGPMKRQEDAQIYVTNELIKKGYSYADAERIAAGTLGSYRADIGGTFAGYVTTGAASNIGAAKVIGVAEQNLPRIAPAFVPQQAANKVQWFATRATGMLPFGAAEGVIMQESQATINRQPVTNEQRIKAALYGGVTALGGQLFLESRLPKTSTGSVKYKEKIIAGKTYEAPTIREGVLYGFDPTEPFGDIASQYSSRVRVSSLTPTQSNAPLLTSLISDTKQFTKSTSDTLTKMFTDTKTQPVPRPINKAETLPQPIPQPQPLVKTQPSIYSEPAPQPTTEPVTIPLSTSPAPQPVVSRMPYFRIPWGAPSGAMLGKGAKGGKQWVVKNPIRDLGVEYFTGLKSKTTSIKGKI